MHFLHLSTAGSIDLVRRAKEEGLPVTAEAAPHHMFLTHAEVAGYDPVFKVNPPLRTAEDVAAVVAGLCDGTIDAVATDHAPHAPEAKDVPFDEAPPGMLGLQTALPIAWEVLSPHLAPERVFALLEHPARGDRAPESQRPAAGRPQRTRGSGRRGSSRQPLCVRPRRRRRWWSRGGWPAGAGTRRMRAGRFQGAVRHTVLRGEPVVIDAAAQR